MHPSHTEPELAEDYLRIVERRAELARLAVQAHQRKYLLVYGPEGVGKTRLLQEFIRTQPRALYVSQARSPHDLLLSLVNSLRLVGVPGLPSNTSIMTTSSLKGMVNRTLDVEPFLMVLDHLEGPSRVITKIVKELNYYGRTPIFLGARSPHMEDIGALQPICADKNELCNRVADLLIDMGQSAELARLLQQVNTLKIHLSEGKSDAHHYQLPTASSRAATTASLKFHPCEICEHIQQQSFDFLRHYQYELATNPKIQRDHAERGGFCSLHTWQYESIASPQRTCSAYPALLNYVAARLAEKASGELTPDSVQAGIAQLIATTTSCPLCRVRSKSESEALASVIHKLSEGAMQSPSSLSAICLLHLRLLTAHLEDTDIIKQLLEREAFLLKRIAEDMQRYSLKHDALRRYLTSDEERDSSLKALLLLVGHRSVSSPLARGVHLVRAWI